MDDDEFNTEKKSLDNGKYKSRRWSNCFGLAKKFKRLKNRLSTIQANDTPHLQLSTRRNSNATLKHEYSLRQHKSQRHHYSTSTIASCSAQDSGAESNEQLNCLAPLPTYHLSSVNTPNQLSPPPRNTGRNRAFSDTSGYCYNDWRQFTDSYQKMNQRLSLDTESIHQQYQKRRQNNNINNVTTSSIISESPVDVASVRNSMLIYQEDDASTLRAHSNTSTISNSSSLTPQAPPAQPAFLAPYRSGTLGYPKSTQKFHSNNAAPPPLPSFPLLVQHQHQYHQQQQISPAIPSCTTSSSGRLSVDSISRSSTLSSIDIPLKERRRRRSPLMFSDNDKLTLPIPRHDIISIQQNIHSNDSKRIDDSTIKKGSYDRDTTKLKSREKAMQQLEGASSQSSSLDRKLVSMTRIASPKFLDEQLVAAAAAAAVRATGTDDSTLLINKAHYDAVVSRTIQQQRRPSSSIVSSPVTTTQTISLLSTPSAGKAVSAVAPSSYSKYGTPTTTTISPFLPTPSSSSSHHYPSPPPLPPPSSSVYFPSTPNSLDSYL